MRPTTAPLAQSLKNKLQPNYNPAKAIFRRQFFREHCHRRLARVHVSRSESSVGMGGFRRGDLPMALEGWAANRDSSQW